MQQSIRFGPALPDRPPSTLLLSPSSPTTSSFCFFAKRLLFFGSGGAACSGSFWTCSLTRGLGFIVGGLLVCLTGLTSTVPLVAGSNISVDSCLLNWFTILLTFPPERLTLLSLSPRGGELHCGFGGISGLGLASGLKGKVDVGDSWTDMVAGRTLSLLMCFTPRPDLLKARFW